MNRQIQRVVEDLPQLRCGIDKALRANDQGKLANFAALALHMLTQVYYLANTEETEI